MSRWPRGVLLGGAQILLLLAVWGRFTFDRATLPRVWAKSVPVDPDDPFRGRYVRIRLEADDRRTNASGRGVYGVEDDRLVVRDAPGMSGFSFRPATPSGGHGVVAWEPVAYFIPEHGPDPSSLAPGEELWVEVSVPRRGPPRPIRIEVRRAP